MGLAETAELAVRIGLDDNLSPGLRRMQGNLNRFESGTKRIGRGVGRLTGGLAKVGAVAATVVAGGLTAVAAAAIDFDDAFAGVRKTVSSADLAKAGLTLDDLATSFRKLATEIPVSASELARIGEEAGALGVAAGDIVKFSEVVAKLAVTTDLTTDDAAEALGKLGTILKLNKKGYQEFADALVNLGNNGASTEGAIIEIAKRFAGAAKTAGLAKEEILGLSSATSSLGIEPYAAGGALSRLFNNMGTNIAQANKKGHAFSKLVGEPIKNLQRDINKGKGLSIFLKVLDKIRGLKTTDKHKTLAALGVTNSNDRNALILLADGYEELNEQLGIAKDSTGALSREAAQRFDTVKSKLTLLKNSLIEAALKIGGDPKDPTSFVGSIGVAAKKLAAFINDPVKGGKLEALGKRLGKAIGEIDFDKLFQAAEGFANTLSPALATLEKIASLIAKLPPEVIGVGAGALLADRVSGGAISGGLGGIIGGLGEVFAKSLISKVPLLGKAFVQPVFVTNMGVGGIGGGAGTVAGGAGKLAKGLAALSILGDIVGVVGTQQAVSQESSQQALGLLAQMRANIKDGNFDVTQALNGVNQGIDSIRSNPLLVLVQGEALNTLQQMRDELMHEQERRTLPDFRAGERASAGGNLPATITPEITKLRERLAATFRAESRAERNGNAANASRLSAKADRIRSKIDELSRKSANQLAQVRAKQQATIAAENRVRDAVRHKRMSVTANTVVNVNTNVAFAEVKRQARYASRVARTTRLAYR